MVIYAILTEDITYPGGECAVPQTKVDATKVDMLYHFFGTKGNPLQMLGQKRLTCSEEYNLFSWQSRGFHKTDQSPKDLAQSLTQTLAEDDLTRRLRHKKRHELFPLVSPHSYKVVKAEDWRQLDEAVEHATFLYNEGAHIMTLSHLRMWGGLIPVDSLKPGAEREFYPLYDQEGKMEDILERYYGKATQSFEYFTQRLKEDVRGQPQLSAVLKTEKGRFRKTTEIRPVFSIDVLCTYFRGFEGHNLHGLVQGPIQFEPWELP